MRAVSPVFDDLTELEVVLGAAQDEYSNLPVVVGMGRVTCRMELEEAERRAVAEGSDIIITILNFQKPIQPLALTVVSKGSIMENKEFRERLGIFFTSEAADNLELMVKELGGTTSLATLARAEQVVRLCRTLEARSKELSKTVRTMESVDNVIQGRVAGFVAYALKEAARYMEYTSDAEMLTKLAESYLSGERTIPRDVSEHV